MAFFCNCKNRIDAQELEIIYLKRAIKAMQTDVDTLEIKAIEAKRNYAKKLKQLDKETETESKDLYDGVLLRE
jgi:hypothetical protein